MERIKRYSIFNKEIGGSVRVHRDEQGFPFTYPTREQAEREIANGVVARIIQLFAADDNADDRDLMNVRDYIREVEVLENGSIIDPDGNQFAQETLEKPKPAGG